MVTDFELTIVPGAVAPRTDAAAGAKPTRAATSTAGNSRRHSFPGMDGFLTTR
ncbi:hypothetical protein [Fodinicola feengrottensis]|uniref:hypothetical protein n=1 Tax=Fodinicola feengrottensis TaxID=435914 RepID=UPI0013D04D52|nr:hypothetical protein [Fodinicola feengrottensis]